MITRKSEDVGGLLVKAGHRDAGNAVINGKNVSWDACYQIGIVPLEESGIKKYPVSDGQASRIQKKLDSVHWGAFVALKLEGRKIVDVEIISDCLEQFYNDLENGGI